MTFTIQWYDRDKNTFKPIYENVHHGTIHGDNAAECMGKYNCWRQNHDLVKYTCSEIVYVAD